MLRKFALASGLAVMCAGVAVGAQEQQPATGTDRPGTTQEQPATPRQPTPQPATGQQDEEKARTQAAATTLEGCVYHERDVPGRTPNVAERAGILEDYILVASSTAAGTPGATGTTGATGSAAGAAKMFKLEHKPDQQLSAMVGKRVQVTGKIDAEATDARSTAGAGQDKSAGPDQVNLPEFEITSIREAQGNCPAKPEVNR